MGKRDATIEKRFAKRFAVDAAVKMCASSQGCRWCLLARSLLEAVQKDSTAAGHSGLNTRANRAIASFW